MKAVRKKVLSFRFSVFAPGKSLNPARILAGQILPQRKHWLESVRGKGISQQELNKAFQRMEYARMTPLNTQLGWLEKASFQNVDCWYKNFSFAVFGGYR